MQVEIWSDIVCPWCYIGKRRFETALADFDHAEAVQVTYRSFELDPTVPRDVTETLIERLTAKYGTTPEKAREMQDHVTELAAAEGLEYRMDLARPANTFDGHRLIHLAAQHGRQAELKERLMRAYFTEGKAIADPATLTGLATEVGLPKEAVTATLQSDWFAQAVRDDEEAARTFGISGVPTFIVDRRVGVSGAQPPEVLRQLLDEGWRRAQAPNAVPNP